MSISRTDVPITSTLNVRTDSVFAGANVTEIMLNRVGGGVLMNEQLNIKNYVSSSDETFWSYFVGQRVKIVGAVPYTDKDDNGADVQGVKATIAEPVSKDGNQYTVLKTTWQVVVKTLLGSELQKKFSEGAELPCTAQKAEGKRYYTLA